MNSEPIPYLACFIATAHFYNLPPRALPALQRAIGGATGKITTDDYGTTHLGLMQVDTQWIGHISNVTRKSNQVVTDRLLFDPCYSIAAAGDILHTLLGEHHGDLMLALSYYPSFRKPGRAEFAQRVVIEASILFCTSDSPCNSRVLGKEDYAPYPSPEQTKPSRSVGLKGDTLTPRPHSDDKLTTQSIHLSKSRSGVSRVEATINGVRNLEFIIDSGASDISIPKDVFYDLLSAGTVTEDDLLGEGEYILADGTKVKNSILRIHSVKVGDFVLSDVAASIVSPGSPPLLGQSFLSRFRSWKVDNSQGIITLSK